MSPLIAIHACRSGVGRSQVAGCLSLALAHQGQRVALIEAGLDRAGSSGTYRQAATTDLLRRFGLPPDYPPCSLRLDWPEPAPWDAAIADLSYLLGGLPPSNRAGALYLLRSDPALNADAARLEPRLQALHQALQLDVLLLALAPDLHPASLTPLALSDGVLLVLTVDHRDFHATAVSAEVLRHLGAANVQLVLNGVPAALNTPQWQQQVEAAYEIPVAALLPWAENMALLNGQELFYLRWPAAPFSQAVQALARQHLARGLGQQPALA